MSAVSAKIIPRITLKIQVSRWEQKTTNYAKQNKLVRER